MILSRQKLVIIISIVLVILGLMYGAQQIIDRMTKTGKVRSPEKISEPLVEIKDKKLLKRIANPKKYNIAVSTSKNVEQSQMQWDYETKQIIKKSKILADSKENEVFVDALKTRQKYEERVARIDQRIESAKEALEKSPNDDELIAGLNDLYQMRSMVTTLEDVIVTKDSEK